MICWAQKENLNFSLKAEGFALWMGKITDQIYKMFFMRVLDIIVNI